jgi:hypothetical protein
MALADGGTAHAARGSGVVMAAIDAASATPATARMAQATGSARRPASSDLMAILGQLEAKFPVAEWRAGETPLWPLLRVRWFFAEWERHYTSGASGGVRGRRLAQMARGALAASRARSQDRDRNRSAASSADIVCLSDGVSFSQLDGRWIERFCDPVLAAARDGGWRGALWTPLHAYHLPRWSPSAFLQPAIDRCNLRGMLRARLAPPQLHLPGHAEVLRALAAAGFGDAELQQRRIAADAARLEAVSRLHARLLERARPRLAFVVSYYSLEGMAFVLACHRARVPVVELQHGVQGEFHPAYAAWQAVVPAGGKHPLLPDVFWVWSPWEAGVIGRWSEGTAHAALDGGNPWAGIWSAGSPWPGVASALDAAGALKARASGRPVVLATLQYGLAASEQLDPLAAFIRTAGQEFAVWVRLHPAMRERREEVRALLAAAGPFELDACSDVPLQALLPQVDVHWTHSSSTVIDAAQFGVPSVLGSEYGAELFAPLIAGGVARIETGDAQALRAALLAALAAPRTAGQDAAGAAAGLAGLLRRFEGPRKERA